MSLLDVRALTHDDTGLVLTQSCAKDRLPPRGPTDISTRPFSKHICLLAVHDIITNQQLLLRHPQRNPQHVFDEAQYQARPHDIPCNDEHGARNLVPDLHAVSSDRAARVGDAESRGAGNGSEDAGGASAEKTGHEMGVEDAEDIVDGAHECDFLAENVHGEPRYGAGSEADRDGTPAGHDTRTGSDGNEAADHAVDGANDGGFAVVERIANNPDEQARRGADVRIQHGETGVHPGVKGSTAIEAVPTKPEYPRSYQDGANIVGAVILAVSVQARSDPPRCNETSGTGRKMDDVASTEIDDAEDGEKAATPDGVADHAVGEGGPEGHEDDPSEEVHTAEEGAR